MKNLKGNDDSLSATNRNAKISVQGRFELPISGLLDQRLNPLDHRTILSIVFKWDVIFLSLGDPLTRSKQQVRFLADVNAVLASKVIESVWQTAERTPS